MGADKTGAPSPYVERGELDQEQHDAVRDVFYVPGRGHPRAGRPVRRARRASTPASSCSARTSTCRGGPTWPVPACWSPRPPGSRTSRRSATADRSTIAAACRCATGCAPAGSATRSPAGCGSCPRRSSSRCSSWSCSVLQGRFHQTSRRGQRLALERPSPGRDPLPAQGAGRPIGPCPTRTCAACRCGAARARRRSCGARSARARTGSARSPRPAATWSPTSGRPAPARRSSRGCW